MSEERWLRFNASGGIAAYFAPGRDGVPTIVVHGVPLEASFWHDVLIPYIGQRPIALLDLPWHGDSFTPETADPDHLSAAVNGVCDALGWTRCCAIGHSIGSGAVLLAGLQRPGRFTAQLLVAPHGDFSPADRERYLAFADMAQGDVLSDEMVAIAIDLFYPRAFQRARPEVVEQRRAALKKCSAPRVREALLAVAAFPTIAEALQGYPTEVTAVVMAEDACTPRAWAEPYLRAVGARVIELPGGHMPMDEDTEAFRAVLESFWHNAAT